MLPQGHANADCSVRVPSAAQPGNRNIGIAHSLDHDLVEQGKLDKFR